MSDEKKAPAPPVSAPAVEVVHRKRGDAHMLEITGTEPGYHYRWVRSRKDENHLAVSRAKLKGYVLVKDTEGVKTVVEPDTRADGTLAIGDLVLMKCKDVHHAERVREKRVRHEQIMASASAETEEMARQKGVVTIKDPDHNRVAEKFTP